MDKTNKYIMMITLMTLGVPKIPNTNQYVCVCVCVYTGVCVYIYINIYKYINKTEPNQVRFLQWMQDRLIQEKQSI